MYDEIDGTTPTSNAPLRGGKGTMFEGGTRVPCVVAWPGITPAGSQQDTVVQSEDFFPTLLAGLNLGPVPGQIFDGENVLAAFKGESLERGPCFHYFPHDPGVPDWLPPAVSVRQGEWKLIRVFHAGQAAAHRYLLYDLSEDISETRNLATENPALVRELDALIEGYLERTGAVVPLPNPKFDPLKYQPELEGKQQPKGKAKKGKAKGSKA
jgi:arylsulfatase A-like enzyme